MTMHCWPWGDEPERRRWRASVGIVAVCLLVSFALGAAMATALALIYLAPALQQAGCCT